MPCKVRFVSGLVAKRFLIVAGLALLAPLAASATSLLSCVAATICIDNGSPSNTSPAMLTGTTAGLSLSNSVVTAASVNGLVGDSVSLTTGGLTSGSLGGGGMFAASGSSFVITSTSGIVFQGTFAGPVTWALSETRNSHGVIIKYSYTLSGNLSGTWQGLSISSGSTAQMTFTSKTPFNGSLPLNGGVTNFVTPEPGTLGLMGTGFVGIALVGLRKLKTSVGERV